MPSLIWTHRVTEGVFEVNLLSTDSSTQWTPKASVHLVNGRAQSREKGEQNTQDPAGPGGGFGENGALGTQWPLLFGEV